MGSDLDDPFRLLRARLSIALWYLDATASLDDAGVQRNVKKAAELCVEVETALRTSNVRDERRDAVQKTLNELRERLRALDREGES